MADEEKKKDKKGSSAERRYGKSAAIKPKDHKPETDKDVTPKEEGTGGSPKADEGKTADRKSGADPEPDRKAGDGDVSVVHERHGRERDEMAERHAVEMRQMHKRHAKEHEDMGKRHIGELAAPGEKMAEGESDKAGKETVAKVKDEGKKGAEP